MLDLTSTFYSEIETVFMLVEDVDVDSGLGRFFV